MKRICAIVKKVTVLAICMSIMLGSISFEVFASPYSQKYAKCPWCNKYNKSIGYNENFHWDNISSNAGYGNKCEFCNIVIPEGENHSWQRSYDVYIFSCDSYICINRPIEDSAVYYVDYPNPILPSNHNILKYDDLKK